MRLYSNVANFFVHTCENKTYMVTCAIGIIDITFLHSPGVHCAIGGGSSDFIITSTLSSQAPTAVGRALAIGMPACTLPSDSISFVTVGDGSVNNAHFLSATNMSEYSEFRRVRCPVLFGISDNRLCISLRGYGWLNRFLEKLRMRVFKCNGNNVFDVYRSTAEAAAYCRESGKPATVVYQDIQRRFGHAATDRQHAYMSGKEIDRLVRHNPVEGICAQVGAVVATQYRKLQIKIGELFPIRFY